MKISVNWLKTLLNTTISVTEISDLLTSSGLEVEGVETFETLKGGLKGLVVGKVIECIKHPDADRLSLTKIDIGSSQPLSIVCGATNIAINQKVIVATVGTKLHPINSDPFEIKKSKIRGVLSEGMICAEDEIGLGNNHDGILILPDSIAIGTPAADYFNVDTDTILEIGLTPNRCDAASHIGVARELAAILNTINKSSNFQLNKIGLNKLPPASNSVNLEISIINHEACKRYSGLVISDISIKESPNWLINKLKSIGVRPINNVVDATNFVLHELGQPIHAFDLSKIKGNKIIVKTATANDKFITLDGIERILCENDLMINNAFEPICLAGIFGGLESSVSENTTSIFLEAAFFDSNYIRKSSKHHGLKTDASFRFERGTDPEIIITALTRAANLILEIAGGKISMGITDIYPVKIEPYNVAFSYLNCNQIIGKDIDRATIKKCIINLGIHIESEIQDGLILQVPRFKADVYREIDVIEEVMRIYGYNNVECNNFLQYSTVNENNNLEFSLENKLNSTLEGFGFNEIMNLSISKESYYLNQETNVKIINPLSNDLNVLRSDLLFGGLETICYNLNRKNYNLKFFEIGRVYHKKNEKIINYVEQKQCSIFITGKLFDENPYGLNQSADFSFLKATLTNLFQKCGVYKYKISESNANHYVKGLAFEFNKIKLAEYGELSKTVLKSFDIHQPVFYACVNLDIFTSAISNHKINFVEIPKFPNVKRDLALLIDKSIKFQQIKDLAFATELKYLKQVNLFDIFEGDKLGNKKSYAIRFTLINNEATLTDKQIDEVMDKLISSFSINLGAELR